MVQGRLMAASMTKRKGELDIAGIDIHVRRVGKHHREELRLQCKGSHKPWQFSAGVSKGEPRYFRDYASAVEALVLVYDDSVSLRYVLVPLRGETEGGDGAHSVVQRLLRVTKFTGAFEEFHNFAGCCSSSASLAAAVGRLMDQKYNY